MTQTYWKKLHDLIRKYAHSHAMSHHLQELGKELGRNNQAIPKEQVLKLLTHCKVNDLDYLVDSLLKGHHEGLKDWRVKLLNEERKVRLEREQQFEKDKSLTR